MIHFDFIVIGINITAPHFNGNTSLLVHPTLTNSFAVTYLYTEIRPSSPNGLILFNRQNDGPDYIAIVLRNGLVEFYYNLGGGATVITSNIHLTLGEWHSIEASRSGQSGTLIVDNQLPITGVSPGDFHSLQLSGDLLIGGSPETVTLPDELGTVQHFYGCLRELCTQAMASGGQPVPLVNAAVTGVDITDCPACSCKNGGICVERGSSLEVCKCPLDYTGLLCESELCTVNNPCQYGGQCYVMEGENSVAELMCNCSLPFGGRFCNERKYR